MTALSGSFASEDARAIFNSYHRRPLLRALAIFAFDFSLLTGISFYNISSTNLCSKLAAGFFAGIVMGRLFVIGHDASHGSFSRSRRLNRIVCQLAFLPTLTPYGSWEIAHNQTHHVYTNLATTDYVWAPFSKAAYDALPPWRRFLERLYRTPFGHGLYYGVEIWWKRLIIARGGKGGGESMFVLGVCAGAAVALSYFSCMMAQNIAIVLFCSMVVPFMTWNALMGFIIFEQHTSCDIRWYDKFSSWRAESSQIDAVQHVQFPGPFNTLFHNIMEHHAHHLDPLISLHELPAAQQALEAKAGRWVRQVPWSLRSFLRTTSVCKLYDFQRHRWLGFDGMPTSDRIA